MYFELRRDTEFDKLNNNEDNNANNLNEIVIPIPKGTKPRVK